MTTLTDPTDTRVMSNVPLPFITSISEEELFEGSKIKIQLLMDFFRRQGKLETHIVIKILQMAKEMFESQPNLLEVRGPLTIFGDIHGQYYDLVYMLSSGKIPPIEKCKYLFLGDYVDRGQFSIEVALLILSLKISHPKRVFLLRGNHECRHMTSYFSFRDQCLKKYSQDIYFHFMDVFDTLPIAALVNSQFLCLHGGISNFSNLESIRKINRFEEVPKDGIFCDLMWADPIENEEGKMKGLVQPNQSRGCSYYFGSELCQKFLETNKLSGIIRAHEAKLEGYEMHRWFGKNKFPPVITVFSAPNYANFYNNKGALLYVDKKDIEIVQILGQEHPYHLPDNKNLFEWSIPFVIEKVIEMFDYLVKAQQVVEDPENQVLIELVDRRKIIEELRTLQLFEDESQQNIEIMGLKGKNLSKQIIRNKKAISYSLSEGKRDFNLEKQIDKINEMRPNFE